MIVTGAIINTGSVTVSPRSIDGAHICCGSRVLDANLLAVNYKVLLDPYKYYGTVLCSVVKIYQFIKLLNK